MKGHDIPVRHSTIKRRRIRTVIDNLILIAGHLTNHARKLRLAESGLLYSKKVQLFTELF